MTRRLLHAAAALAVLAVTLNIPAPAHAAPGGPPCTVGEWQNPGNYLGCAGRLGTAAQQRLDCISAPTPSSPSSGMAGWFTARPGEDLKPGVAGRYTRYGMGGYRLEMYDVSCLGGLTQAGPSLGNAFGSGMFTTAAGIVGVTNGLRILAYDPTRAWSWTDGLVEQVTGATYRHVFTPLGALTLVIVGGFLIWTARQGQISKAFKVAGWAVFVMVAVTAIGRWPVATTHLADRIAGGGLQAMHSVLGPPAKSLPAERCPNPDPEACVDQRATAVRAADTATEAVMYRSWLRAVLGSADSPTARTYGPALHDAATFTWAEDAEMRRHPELRKVYVEQKGRQWIAIAERIRTEDPEAYQHLQGVRGPERAGAGLIAVIAALVYSLFDAAASVIILFGHGMFRLVVLLFPLLATVGLAYPAASWLKWLMNAAVAALVNIVVFGAAAGLYLMVVDWLTGSPLAGWIQLVVIAAIGVGVWLATRPVRRFVQMARKPSSEDRVDVWTRTSELRHTVADQIDRYRDMAATLNQSAPTSGVPTSGVPARPRPETTAGVAVR